MKVFLTSLNKKHAFNPIVQRLFDPLSGQFELTYDAGDNKWHRGSDPDAIVLSFIAAEPEFDLDSATFERLNYYSGPIVVVDHSETAGSDFFLGFSELHKSSYYWPVHEYLMRCQNRIKAYFKREMRAGAKPDIGIPVYPVDWTTPTMRQFDGIDTRGKFEQRPIDIFMSWGYSSESRPRLFGELMKQAGRFGAHFCLHQQDLDQALKEKRERIFALLFSPWYRRINLEQIMAWQAQAKISISPKGSGYKCFRTAEAPYNSVMAQQGVELMQWSYPWVDGENCVSLPNADGQNEIDPEMAVEVLWDALRVNQGKLYDIYTKGIINDRNYHVSEYARDYMLPKLLQALK